MHETAAVLFAAASPLSTARNLLLMTALPIGSAYPVTHQEQLH